MKKNKGLITFAFLNYVDKALIFLIPLSVLYIFKDKALYNRIEYVLSFSAVIGIAVELGMRNYMLYAYKESKEREKIVREVKGHFFTLFFLYFIVSLVLAIFLPFDLSRRNLDLIAARTLFSFFLSFFTIYFVVADAPSKVFIFSYLINISTLVIILLTKALGSNPDILYFFLSQIVLNLILFAYILRNFSLVNFRGLFSYLKKSLSYSWPIIINLFLFMVINNYGKIYAFKFLSREEMFQISFVQRIALIIQLAHASSSTYLSKSIYVDESKGVNRMVLRRYTTAIILSSSLAVIIILALDKLFPSMSVRFDMNSIFLILYTIAWCYSAFFELYINKMNRNKVIPVFTLISTMVFLGLPYLFKAHDITSISLAMFVGMLINLGLMLVFLYRADVFKGEAAGSEAQVIFKAGAE
jgi:O-antigen/teichoic acid export membrane protein